MPTYLRWIAALSTGLTVQFIGFIAIGAIAVGTDNRELTGAVGVIVTFVNSFAGMIPAIAVNNWLLKRYPPSASSVA